MRPTFNAHNDKLYVVDTLCILDCNLGKPVQGVRVGFNQPAWTVTHLQRPGQHVSPCHAGCIDSGSVKALSLLGKAAGLHCANSRCTTAAYHWRSQSVALGRRTESCSRAYQRWRPVRHTRSATLLTGAVSNSRSQRKTAYPRAIG